MLIYTSNINLQISPCQNVHVITLVKKEDIMKDSELPGEIQNDPGPDEPDGKTQLTIAYTAWAIFILVIGTYVTVFWR